MSLDLSDLLEEPVLEQRRSRSQAVDSVARPVDKATLIEAFNSEIYAVVAEVEHEAGGMSTAHEENVTPWAKAIALPVEQVIKWKTSKIWT